MSPTPGQSMDNPREKSSENGNQNLATCSGFGLGKGWPRDSVSILYYSILYYIILYYIIV